MTQPQNLPDLARQNYDQPPHRCKLCGVVVRPMVTHWQDGSGSAWCWQGLTQHSGLLEGGVR